MTRALLLSFGLLFALLFGLAAQASALSLSIDAPKNLRTMLEQHLELSRALRDKVELSDPEIDRLSASAPAEARELLQTEGFFNAQVRNSREGDTLHLVVEAGERARISEVTLHFSGEIEGRPLAESLRRGFSLSAGDAFTQSDWASAKVDVLNRAHTQGYAMARWISTVARVEAEKNTVVLSLALDSGPLYHMGELRIEGLSRLPPEVVQRLVNFAPGAPYNEQLLQDFQERLRKTLLFDSVSAQMLVEEGNFAAAPIVVRVHEAARMQATTGLGYHANTGQSVSLEVVNRQPFGLPLRARSKFVYGRDQRLGELELSSHPQPDNSRNIASVQLEQDRSGDEIQTNLSTRVGRIRETEQDERLVYAELLRSQDTTAAGRDTAKAISGNIQWTRRRIDNLILPTDGHQGLLLVGAGRADSSSASAGFFGRAQLKLAAYTPLGANWYGSTRLELDQVFIRSKVGIPEKLLWRAGGDDSVRGYGYQDLGPQVNGATVGGRVAATASLEAAHPLSADWPLVWGAAFVDAGNAADRWQEFKPVWGYGVGVRLRSPIGPLKLDIARGVEARQWRLHFSVGVSF